MRAEGASELSAPLALLDCGLPSSCLANGESVSLFVCGSLEKSHGQDDEDDGNKEEGTASCLVRVCFAWWISRFTNTCMTRYTMLSWFHTFSEYDLAT